MNCFEETPTIILNNFALLNDVKAFKDLLNDDKTIKEFLNDVKLLLNNFGHYVS